MDKVTTDQDGKQSQVIPLPSIDELVEEHYEYLYSYAYRYFRSDDRAEELVQDTFLAATESIARFEGRSAPRTWLTSILRHKIIDRVRKRDREQPYDVEALERESLSGLFDEHEHWHNSTGPLIWGCQPERTLSQKQFLGTLEKCLQKLPERVRQIFLLRELDGFGREEICDQFDLSSSNVGVILHRARLSLQGCLQLNWFGQSEGVS